MKRLKGSRWGILNSDAPIGSVDHHTTIWSDGTNQIKIGVGDYNTWETWQLNGGEVHQIESATSIAQIVKLAGLEWKR